MNPQSALVAIASAGLISTVVGAACHAADFVIHTIDVTFNGNAEVNVFGYSVAGAGDVNNDGFDDVIVGAHADSPNGFFSGSARVISGATGDVLYNLSGDSTDDQFGYSVAGAGDVNNDGFDDLIVGAYLDDNNGPDSGSARVFSGATGAILYTFIGDSPGDLFGVSVSGAGDVNNDGFDDLIVGASADDNNGQSSGSARVFSGASGAILYTFSGDSAGDSFGGSVAGAGDVNGDGFADLIVGAQFDDNNGVNAGSARVFSGATGAILRTFNGNSEHDRLGVSVAGATDLNGDGSDDLIVGALRDDGFFVDSGSAYVFSGSTGAVLYTFYGDGPTDLFGVSVSSAGDVNNDGVSDLIVGADQDDNNGNASGIARVFSGIDGAVLYTFEGDRANDYFGFSVAGAGDVNGDGYADMLVGAYGSSRNGNLAGSARLFISSPGGWPKTPPPAPCTGDTDGNRTVNFSDITTVLTNFGTACP